MHWGTQCIACAMHRITHGRCLHTTQWGYRALDFNCNNSLLPDFKQKDLLLFLELRLKRRHHLLRPSMVFGLCFGGDNLRDGLCFQIVYSGD